MVSYNTKENSDNLASKLIYLITNSENKPKELILHTVSGLIYSYANASIISTRVPDIIKGYHLEIYGPDDTHKKYRCRLINNSDSKVEFFGEGNSISEAVVNATLESDPNTYF